MLRIPGARPVKLIPKPKTSNPNITTTKISTRSSNWNERFVLEKIPEYNALDDPHCGVFKSPGTGMRGKGGLTGMPVGKSKAIMNPGGLRVAKRPISTSKPIAPAGRSIHKDSRDEAPYSPTHGTNLKGNRSKGQLNVNSSGNQSQGYINEDMLGNLLDELIFQWDNEQASEELKTTFLNSVQLLKPKMAAPLLAKEIDDLQKGRAILQITLRGIRAREECLKHIEDMCVYLSHNPDDIKVEDIQQESKELIHSLRILTLNVVEMIVKWREQIIYMYLLAGGEVALQNAGPLPFIFQETNYLLKINYDSQFLNGSELKKMYNFIQQSDPFLLAIATPIAYVYNRKKKLVKSNKPVKGKLFVPVPGGLLKRIRGCELILGEEYSMNNTNSINEVEGTPKRLDAGLDSSSPLKENDPHHEKSRSLSGRGGRDTSDDTQKNISETAIVSAEDQTRETPTQIAKRRGTSESRKSGTIGYASNMSSKKYDTPKAQKTTKVNRSPGNKGPLMPPKKSDSLAREKNPKSPPKQGKEPMMENKNEINKGGNASNTSDPERISRVSVLDENKVGKESETSSVKEDKKDTVDNTSKVEDSNEKLGKSGKSGKLEKYEDPEELKNPEEPPKIPLEKTTYEERKDPEEATDYKTEKSIEKADIKINHSERRDPRIPTTEYGETKEEKTPKYNISPNSKRKESTRREEATINIIDEDHLGDDYEDDEFTPEGAENEVYLPNEEKDVEYEAEQIFEEEEGEKHGDYMFRSIRDSNHQYESPARGEVLDPNDPFGHSRVPYLNKAHTEEDIVIDEDLQGDIMSPEHAQTIPVSMRGNSNININPLQLEEGPMVNSKDKAPADIPIRAKITPQRTLTSKRSLRRSEATEDSVRDGDNINIREREPGSGGVAYPDPIQANIISPVHQPELFRHTTDHYSLESPDLLPLNVEESQIMGFMDVYIGTLDSRMSGSFPPAEETIRKAFRGFDTYWMCYCKSNEYTNIFKYAQTIEGLVVFYLDNTCPGRRRVILSHLTTRREEDYSVVLYQVLAFIWTQVNCDEIRVGLYHLREEGKLVVNKEIKQLFVDGHKFRWKTLTNLENGQRIIVLGLNRPVEGITFLNPRGMDVNREPITFKMACLVSAARAKLGDDVGVENVGVRTGHCSLLNGLFELSSTQYIGDTPEGLEQDIQHPETECIHELLQEVDEFKVHFPNCVKSEFGETILDACKLSESEGLSLDIDNVPKSSFIHSCSVISITARWQSYLLIPHTIDNISYNYIRLSVPSFTFAVSGDITFTLIKTDDSKINAFVMHGSSISSNTMSCHLLDLIKQYTKEMQMVQNDQFDEVWIPGFNIMQPSQELMHMRNYMLGDKYVSSAVQASEFSIYAPDGHNSSLLVSGLNRKYVVEEDFLFGLVHEQLDEQLEIPLAVTFVKREQWIKTGSKQNRI